MLHIFETYIKTYIKTYMFIYVLSMWEHYLDMKGIEHNI